MKRIALLSGITFGAIMIVLSFAIAAETILRKFFSHSMGGIDELGGYAVAIVAPLAFIVAAHEQAHIRINVLHGQLPLRARAWLNVVAAVSLSLLALFLLYFTFKTVQDTLAYRSIAQTPWATPLIYPQGVWLVAMASFAIGTLVIAARTVMLAFRGDWQTLDRRYGPGSPQDELEAELADLKARDGMQSDEVKP
ncbi:Tripartite ATP-independent transporter, DctQ component [Devosia enhydra]|uniref:TRAP transporter small permease protein n=1 Tax=Devosia enhydra TaxID=665118 RepID=A0A1K2HXY2_9HYPH|nr:TRAP transporter small permease [Devosia enhydra]SFZ84684.1 Tripartite ATP-independent transporter, DctQ component [Devosia enhydra]